MSHHHHTTDYTLTDDERAALRRLCLDLPPLIRSLPSIALRNSLHGALCETERVLGIAAPLRAERRRGMMPRDRERKEGR